MKKFLFSMICTLLPILASAQVQNEELTPYAVLEGNTLTFYYDDQKETRSGMDIGPFSTDTDREWADQCESIEIVTFNESFKSYMPTSTSYWFYGCTNLTEINYLENLMTDNVENMWGMFYGCSSLTSLDLSGFNTDMVKDMDSMFNGCSSLTSLNLSSFNTSLVGSMGYMFSGCSSLTSLNLSSFETPEVEYMGWMFQGCSSLKTLDLSSFDTSNVIDMGLMFSHCSNLETIWVSDSWTDNRNEGNLMFELCEKLVGGQGTVYDADHINASYAHIDEGATNPGYFTDPNQPVPYAVLNEGNTVLTFYYDNQKVTRGGMSVGPFTFDENTGTVNSGWDEQRENIEQVVFDESFANCTTITSTSLWFYNFTKLTTIKDLDNLKTSNATDMSTMFALCSNLTSLNVSGFDTSKATNMFGMFAVCSSLTNLDLSSFNTSNVTNMSSMFYNCSSLTTIYVGEEWSTEKITSEESGADMFSECTALVGGASTTYDDNHIDYTYAHIDGGTTHPGYLTDPNQPVPYAVLNEGNTVLTFYYDNQKATRGGMSVWPFADSSQRGWDEQCGNIEQVVFNESFANCTTVTSTSHWFDYFSHLTTITGLENLITDNVTDMSYMFGMCSSLTSLDLSGFNTANVTNMSEMFYNCSSLITIYAGEGWSTEKITSEEYGANMFIGCTAIIGGINTKYDENHADYTYAHIDGGTSNPGYLTGSLGKMPYALLSENNTVLTFYYDDQKIARMSVGPFTEFSQRGWDEQREKIKQVVFDESFTNCTTITSTGWWFYGFTNLTTITGLENLKTDNVEDMSGMFSFCESLTNLDVSGFNTTNVTNMSEMFHGCSGMTSLDVSGFNTTNVTNLSGMFDGCYYLASLNVSGFDTSKAADMSSMFRECAFLINLDLRNFNTNNTTKMDEMFSGCSSLTTIYVEEGWSTENIEEGANIFKGCTALVGGAGTRYDENHADYTYAHIDEGASNPGYLSIISITEEPYAVLSDDNTVLTFYYDDQKVVRGGMNVGPFINSNQRGWKMRSYTIKHVVFDESFANCTTITSTSCWFSGFLSLTTITGLENLKTDNVIDMSGMFSGCESLTTIDVSGFNTENVTNMSRMFSGCDGLTTIDVSGFNTENVTDMSRMFISCDSFTSLDLSTFNTSNVENMAGMFESCYNLISVDVSGFNTSKVKNMCGMFCESPNLTSIDVSGFDTSEVIDMSDMFTECKSLINLDVSGFVTSKATNISGMFGRCISLETLNLRKFNTANVSDMSKMFECDSLLTTIYVGEGWSTENISTEDAGANMFRKCTALVGGEGTTYDENHVDYTYARIDGGVSNPGYLTVISAIEEPYAVLNEDNTILTFFYDDQKAARGGMIIVPFDEAVDTPWYDNKTTIKKAVIDESFADYTTLPSTAEWFSGMSNLIGITGLSNLKTDNVTDMSSMFSGCSSLTALDLGSFNTKNVENMAAMFFMCSSLESLNVSSFNTQNVTNMQNLFQSCSSLTSLDVTSFDTRNVENMANMFDTCSNLTSIDLSHFNTENVKNMDYMFVHCTSLTSLDLTSFDTHNVESMNGTFSVCSGLKSLDLSNFETSKVKNTNEMFFYCENLATIYVSNGWTTANVTDSGIMFTNCLSLVGGRGTKYNSSHIDAEYAHIDGGTSNPGYLTDINGPLPYAVLSENNTILTFYYDDQKATRGGMDVGPFEQWGGQGTKSGWSDVNEQITTVVFDESFANCTTLTSTAYWFYGCENLTTIKNISNLKTDNVTDINSMFGDCHSLKSIDFSSLNLSNVTNMHQVFEDCRALESIDFSGVNTENVTNMGDLFLNCKSLKTIDISSFNTKNVTKMTSMFYKCDVLTTIYVGEGWTTENVTESGEMFEKSPNLVGGRGTTYDENHIGIEYAHIDGGTSNPGYLTDINGVSEETWAKLQSRIEYGTDVLSRAKEISTIDQALIEKLDEALQNANQMYKIHEASEDEVLHMIEVLNERINDVEEAMNQPASEETWEELKATIEYGTDVLAKAKEISTIDQWLIEELDMTLDSGNQMYKIHEASEEEVLNMIDELNWRIKEVEEAMNQPASDEAWAELNKAVETGEKLQTEAKGVSTVEPWALEELENMTAKGSEMYKVHTAGEEEVRHMTEELNQIINEVEEMMRKQPQGEASFDGLTAYVSGNATLDDAFKSVGGRSEAAKTIAAIVWNADNALTADMLSGIDNPNLLVYVTEASKAPSGVQNVIIDGVASEIVLTDATGNNNFYCPQSFTAKSISYSRDFSQTTEIDVCRGWETIALPFDVQSITHESHGTLVPFGGSDNGYPFWLRQLSTNGLARATKIEANRPYLICMPNNIIYPPEYNQNGTVTFSSSNVTVPVTSARSSTSAGVTLHATFQQVTKSSSVYALNVGETRGEYPEGSVFEQNYRDIRPFQAYTTHRASTRSFITLESLGGNDDATGIEELRIKNSEFGDAEGVWYSLDGRRLDAKPTKKGVYVKDGRKIVIK